MFETTRNDSKLLKELIQKNKAYPEGIYDFTFEDRFLIYHYSNQRYTRYIALDKESELASEVKCVKSGKTYNEKNYTLLIPDILYSIKYTGDYRHLMKHSMSAEELILYIFRTILPCYGYTVRPQQIKLSLDMYHGLKNHQVSINEAEVGTGKSMAYLVAGFVAKKYLLSCDEPITITTSSIELQKALVAREIPNLSRMLQSFGVIKEPLTVMLRKGKEHYLCPQRYRLYYEQIKGYERYQSNVQKMDELIGEGTAMIDLDDIDLRPSTKDKICVKGPCKDCKYRRKGGERCGYSQYLEKSNHGTFDFLVTNHNMYLMSMKIAGENRKGKAMFPSSSYVIVDEAHKLKQAAEDVFGERLVETIIPDYISSVRYLCYGAEHLMEYKKLLGEIEELNKRFFAHLRANIFRDDFENGKNTVIKLGFTEKEYLREIKTVLKRIDALNHGGDVSNEGQAEAILNAIEKLLGGGNEMHYWLETDDNQVLSFCCAPKQIAKTMYQYLWKCHDTAHILTSGTMSDGMSFDFFMNENGIDQLEAFKVNTTTTESPFQYAKNARLFIPKDMPFPNNENEEYIEALARMIVRLVRATYGHTAILFTSYSVLKAVFELVKDELEDFDLICMSRSNKGAIEEFKESSNAVLFASGSMWEGVDFPGDCLSSVIITRLPFPMRSATMEQKKAHCKSTEEFVKKYAVPEMLIKLRQGAGRLIRTESDTGLVSILDSRAYEGSSARCVQHVLRKYPRVENMQEIEQFFKDVKSKRYFKKGK
ncbi:MAG: ATP-dependent DNA helicase [Clostridia bacterium]|nr:ATP-dependent DNA helicase [Clostridia bacterium]